MIEASNIVDLTECAALERSEDGLVRVGGGTHGGQSLILVTAGRRGLSDDSSGIVLQEIDEMTPKEELEANSMLDVDFKEIKSSFEELCPVCGDRVSGYHYGLLTCESCKGFFKRTVQNKKVYSCVDNRSCQIDKSQRKRCPYCRFQKCLNVGMKLEAVRSDRMRGGRNKFGPMYKRDRALKQQAARHVHPLQDSCIGELSLIANGMIEVGSPGSPEDVKPDPHILQASLRLYSDAVPNSTTSSIVSSLISGSNCLSSTAAAPSSTASISTSSSSHASCTSPTPAHPHHHHLPHSNHHLLVPVSPSDFTQNFSHISATSQHQSPKTFFPHHNKSQHHPHNGSTTIELGSLSPNSLHYSSNHISHANQSSEYHQPQPNSQITQQRQNSPLLSSVQDRESSYPNVIEALRPFKRSPLTCHSERSLTCHSERSLLLPLINEIKATLSEESGVKQKMITFMQSELSQTDSANPEQFLPILCRMVDQLLFLMVEWARNSTFFKEIKVEDQMKLLHNSWSEILILDFIYRQVHNVWGKEIRMPNGEVVGFEILDKFGLGDVKAKVFELVKKGRELSLDFNEYMCLKFIILLSPDVSGLENRSYIEQSQEKITAALLEYCRQVYPNMGDKYSQLLMRLPEIRLISIRTEDFLYFKHLNNEVPDQTLLTEVLHAKRRG